LIGDDFDFFGLIEYLMAFRRVSMVDDWTIIPE